MERPPNPAVSCRSSLLPLLLPASTIVIISETSKCFRGSAAPGPFSFTSTSTEISRSPSTSFQLSSFKTSRLLAKDKRLSTYSLSQAKTLYSTKVVPQKVIHLAGPTTRIWSNIITCHHPVISPPFLLLPTISRQRFRSVTTAKGRLCMIFLQSSYLLLERTDSKIDQIIKGWSLQQLHSTTNLYI